MLGTAIFLALGAGIISLIGQGIEASSAKKEARRDVSEANAELVKAKNLATGSMIAQTAAAGVGGQSVQSSLGRTQTAYNDVISKNQRDLDEFILNTDLNLAFNTVSTVLGTGTSIFSAAFNAGAFDEPTTPSLASGRSPVQSPVGGNNIVQFDKLRFK